MTHLVAALLSSALLATSAAAQERTPSNWAGVFANAAVGAPAKPRKTRRTYGLSTKDIHGDPTLFNLRQGYQHDFGQLVIGGEINRQVNKATVLASGVAVEDTRHLQARIGYDAGDFLPYAMLGYSWQDTTNRQRSFSDEGAAFGIGAAYQINDWVVLGTELIDSDLVAGSGLREQLTTTLTLSLRF